MIPIGKAETGQHLLKLTRTAPEAWKEEKLGAVRFLPLIGEQGWTEDGTRTASTHVPGQARSRSLPELNADVAEAYRRLRIPT